MNEPPDSQSTKQAQRLAKALALIEEARRNSALELDLINLKLTEVPDEVSQLTQLQTLRLSGNALTKLPEWISGLSELKELMLGNNMFSELPEVICELTQLQGLYVPRNRIRSLPESFGRLSQLRILSFYENRLKALPESFGRLVNLEMLLLEGNQLKALPESVQNLRALKELYLHGNKLGLPIEVIGPNYFDARSARARPPADPKAILEYYFRVRGRRRRPLNEAKLILIGRGAVGKTSLVNRLVHGKFERGEKKTEGIQITEWPLRLNGKEDVRLNVWDFGGQEIMHATHQFFLTERSLYLVVLNGREGGEDADAEYWLRLVESFGGDSPVIVVLNKIKEHPFDVVRRALQQKYPFIRDFIRTDCEDGTGIEELRHAVERETDRLEHLRDAFPAAWFSIKDSLAGMKKNYLSFDEYRRFCEEQGEQDSKAQEALAGYLHNLGIVLNYKDDPRLQDKHVLNPHWVTGGIYKILNSEKLEQQKGEIRLNELSEILDPEEYPSDMRRFILDLMKRFELCFSFPDDDTHHLVPELLDKQEPQATAAFRPGECLNFQYHYPVLPEGLLPRFIVRTRALSEGLARWRSGVILKFEGNRALVKGDLQDKQVFINVSGPLDGRRRLLAVIRSDFERIHRDIRNLKPQEMVPLPGKPETLVPYEKLLTFERSGIEKFHELAAGEAVELDVRELLNGVDLDGARRRAQAFDGRTRGVRVFISYSHRDESFRKELETHLKILQQRGLVDVWSDRDIEAGDDWKQRIDDNLERADIILLLVSADFNASDYCNEKELKRALERERRGEAVVIPVVVRDANLNEAPFAYLQYLPEGGRAVTLWEHKDSAWRNVSEGIEEIAKQLRAKFGRIG